MQHYVQLTNENHQLMNKVTLNKTYLAYIVKVREPCEIQPPICFLTDTKRLYKLAITSCISYLHFYFRYYLSDVQEPKCQIVWPTLRLLLFDLISTLALSSHRDAGHLRIRSSRRVTGNSCRNSVLSTLSRLDCLVPDPNRASLSIIPRSHLAAYFVFRRRKLNK